MQDRSRFHDSGALDTLRVAAPATAGLLFGLAPVFSMLVGRQRHHHPPRVLQLAARGTVALAIGAAMWLVLNVVLSIGGYDADVVTQALGYVFFASFGPAAVVSAVVVWSDLLGRQHHV
jgi:fumarate reductase subunit D